MSCSYALVYCISGLFLQPLMFQYVCVGEKGFSVIKLEDTLFFEVFTERLTLLAFCYPNGKPFAHFIHKSLHCGHCTSLLVLQRVSLPRWRQAKTRRRRKLNHNDPRHFRRYQLPSWPNRLKWDPSPPLFSPHTLCLNVCKFYVHILWWWCVTCDGVWPVMVCDLWWCVTCDDLNAAPVWKLWCQAIVWGNNIDIHCTQSITDWHVLSSACDNSLTPADMFRSFHKNVLIFSFC